MSQDSIYVIEGRRYTVTLLSLDRGLVLLPRLFVLPRPHSKLSQNAATSLHTTSPIITMTDLATNSDQITVPEDFQCPISLQLMKDPVMNRKGRNYDRMSILKWLNQGNTQCPLTREFLKPSALIPNYSLKAKIEKWKNENDYFEDEGGDTTVGDPDEENGGFVGLLASALPSALSDEDNKIDNNIPFQPMRKSQSQDDDLGYLLEIYNEFFGITSESSTMIRNDDGHPNFSASPQTHAQVTNQPRSQTQDWRTSLLEAYDEILEIIDGPEMSQASS